MTSPSGTYYYPPCAGTGGFLFTNQPFKMTDQPITPGLPGLSEEDCVKLSIESGYGPGAGARLTRAAYQRGADDQLEACARWLEGRPPYARTDANAITTAMRPNPPSLKEQALAAARIELNANGKNGSLIIRALEALPE